MLVGRYDDIDYGMDVRSLIGQERQTIGISRVLILNQYYPPDTAATGVHSAAIAERLVARGHEVVAIVGQPSYMSDARDAPPDELQSGVHVHRVAVGSRRGREGMSTRVVAYLRYLAGASAYALRSRAEVVICFHTPPGLPLVGLLASRRSGARLVYVPQDIHPDILLASGFMKLPAIVVRMWDAVNRFVLRRADRTVALGEGMRKTLLGKGADPDSAVVIPLWAEPELEPRPTDVERRAALGVPDGLLVLYAGNMGVMHPLEPVLAAAERLAGEDISFVFAGTGVRRQHWERLAADRGLANVHFLPFQHGVDYERLIAASDVALVAFDRGMERLAVPSRSFAFLSAGRPIIALMDAEADVAMIVESSGAGWHVWEEDDLVDLLRSLRAFPARHIEAGVRAREVFKARFRRADVTSQYAAMVDDLAGPAT